MFLGACLVSSVAVVATDVGVVHAALTYPTAMSSFPVCLTDDAEFCVETLEFTPDGGTKKVIANPINNAFPSDPGDPWIGAFISGTYSGASGPAGYGGVFPSLSINFYGPGAMRAEGNLNATLDGIDKGLYRVVLRTGDYDPSYLLLSGEHVDYSVTRGDDGYFTVDLSARPTPYAAVVVMNGDQTELNACQAANWVTNCEANSAYRNYLLVSMVMAPAAQRETLRGTWIATNASTFSMGQVNFLTGEFKVNAAGPHYLPDDFGEIDTTTDLSGRKLNPAHFEMFIPYETIADVVSKVAGIPITVSMVKLYLSKPDNVIQGTIKEVAGSAVVEKAQTLSFSIEETGILVDFNLTHFSAPNPKIKLRDPLPSTRKVQGNGVVITPVRSAKRSVTYSAASLYKPSGGKVTKLVVASTSTSICKVVTGLKVKMLKAGTCKVKVTTTSTRLKRTASNDVSLKVL